MPTIYNKWQSMPAECRSAVIGLCCNAGIDIEHEIMAQNEEDSKRWISLQEAAQIAKVSVFTIRRWCDKNYVKWRKLNRAKCGRILINRCSLLGFIDLQTGGGNGI